MAARNGCSDAARLLLAHGAFIEAKANVFFLLTLLSDFKEFELALGFGCVLIVNCLLFLSY